MRNATSGRKPKDFESDTDKIQSNFVLPRHPSKFIIREAPRDISSSPVRDLFLQVERLHDRRQPLQWNPMPPGRDVELLHPENI